MAGLDRSGRTPGRLDSWKEIAAYINRDERTAIRWHKERGLPVHRVPGPKRGGVFAFREEIDGWLECRAQPSLTADAHGCTLECDAIEHERSDTEEGAAEWRLGLRTELRWIWVVLLAATVLFVFGTRLANSRGAAGSPRVTGYVQLTDDGYIKQGLRRAGQYLYFNESVGGREVLARTSLQGGPVQRIEAGMSRLMLEDVSSDGNRLLVRQQTGAEIEDPLCVMPARGGTPIRLGEIECHEAMWSPDGRRLVFAHNKSIYVSKADGSDAREITEMRGIPRILAWSPDGGSIRFSIDEDSPSRRSLWEMRSSGDRFGSPIPLAKESMSEECCLSIGWTKSGAFLADSAMVRGNYHLWLNPAQVANGLQQPPTALLSAEQGSLAYEVAPGPDSNTAFTLTQSPPRGELVEFDQRSGRFTTFLPGISGQFATYAPDSKLVAYVKTPEQTLWRSSIDGTDTMQLTTNLFGQIQAPSWSHDGSEIAFTAKASGRPWRIFVIGKAGGVPREISNDDDEEGGPSWSLDGRELAYANVMCQERHNCAVHVVELATGKSRILPGSAGLRTARWSPDGRYVAALHPERHQLMLYSFERGDWTKLAEGVNGDDVNWTRDSRYIYVDSPIGDKPVVKKVDVKTGGVAEVVSLDRFRNMIGEFGVWFALAPDNSPIFYRRLTSSEIYRLEWAEK